MYYNILHLKRKIFLAAAGCAVALLLLELLLHLAGPAFLQIQKIRNKRHLRDNGVCRILCIGESTTSYQYPPLLEKMLNAGARGVRFKVIDAGVPAINSEAISRQLDSKLDEYDPDIVIAMVGINDPDSENTLMPDTGGKAGLKSFLVRIKLVKFIWLLAQQHNGRRLSGEGVQGTSDADKKLVPGNGMPADDSESLFEQGQLCLAAGRPESAAECFQRSIERNPDNSNALWMLARIYYNRGEFPRIEKLYSDAIRRNPGDSGNYYQMGELYQEAGRFDKAEAFYQKSISLDSHQYSAYLHLADVYRRQHNIAAAEKVLREGVEKNPLSPVLLGALGMHYMRENDDGKAKYYLDLQTGLLRGIPNQFTRKNYAAIIEKVVSRKKTMICMQYPMRNIGPLMHMLGNDKRVTFVDNEERFRDAVKKYGYGKVFQDNFAGDFGHCTGYGNNLIAENLSRVILEKSGIR